VRRFLATVFLLFPLLLCADGAPAPAETSPEPSRLPGRFLGPNPPPLRLMLSAGPNSLESAKFSKGPRKAKLCSVLNELPSMRAQAFSAIESRLGITYTDSGSIKIKMVDAGEKLARGTGILTARRTTEKDPHGGEVLVINLYNEYVLNGIVPEPAREIAHEMTHAVMRELMGREAYVRLPRWLREGLALYVARQGEDRLSFIFANAAPAHPHSHLNGLEGKHSFNDYAEDYLAVLYIAQVRGKKALEDFVSLVVKELVPYREALERATGMKYHEFLAAAARFAHDRVNAWIEKNPRSHALHVAVRAYARGDYAVAEPLLRRVSAADNPFLAAVAAYYLARTLQKTKRAAEAIPLFEKAANSPAHTSFADDAAWYVLLARYTDFVRADSHTPAEWADMEAAFKRFIDYYPFSSKLTTAWYYLGHLYRRGEAPDHALAAFRHVIEYPRCPEYVAALYNAAECAFDLGKTSLAADYARRALSSRGRTSALTAKLKKLLERIENARH